MGLGSTNIKIIFALAVVVMAILFQDKFQLLYSSFIGTKVETKNKVKGVFSEEELSQFNGENKKKLYLAILGSIFDVTKGKKHYGKGASYNYFIGKDGSRAFITGHFKDDSDGKDHVLDLFCDDIFGLLQWKDTFTQKYKSVGVLNGRYYDATGHPTEYTRELEIKIDQCKIEKEMAQQQDQAYPPCNMEWNADEGSRVWCTKNSGGISRGWVGVPRQLYTPGEDKPLCVCVNIHKDNSLALLKEYDNCKPDSVTCIVAS